MPRTPQRADVLERGLLIGGKERRRVSGKLADVLTVAGLPGGVLNVVTNDLADAGDVVAALIADPRVRMVNFTGSTHVGRIIGVQAVQPIAGSARSGRMGNNRYRWDETVRGKAHRRNLPAYRWGSW